MVFEEPIELNDFLSLIPDVSGAFPKKSSQKIYLHSLDSPEYSDSNSLTFVSKNTSHKVVQGLNCALAFSEQELKEASFPFIQVENIYVVINQILASFNKKFKPPGAGEITSPLPLSPMNQGLVDARAQVFPGSYIGKGSVIHAGCILEPNVTIMENCVLEENVKIQAGAVIGAQGFGFYSQGGERVPIQHSAGVQIEKNSVIGPNTVVASGVLNPTFIGHSSIIDSHVQIAHNVYLGHHAVIASQSGIAGSTTIGHHLLMGGASSIAGHLKIGNHVTVAARTGVTKHVRDGQKIAGFPAQPLTDWKKQQIRMRNIK